MTHPSLFACPKCRADLDMGEAVHCPRCGRVGERVDAGFLTFNGDGGETIRAIGGWSDDFVRALPSWAEGLATGSSAEPSLANDLRQHGLVSADGTLTPLGRGIQYHLDEFRWQKGRKGLDGVLDLSAIGPTVRALDVGCGAGQTLRLLEADRPVELFGIDRDPIALALGWRLAGVAGVPLTLTQASAVALPFRDAAFDLVLTRVALNYMHQRTALAEMTRVLRPGGFLFCRVERVWHDLNLLRSKRGVKSLICNLRDLGWGTVHALTGWQPSPGSLMRGGRAFASSGRLRTIVSRRGCTVIHAAESPNGPIIAGRRTQLILIATKAK